MPEDNPMKRQIKLLALAMGGLGVVGLISIIFEVVDSVMQAVSSGKFSELAWLLFFIIPMAIVCIWLVVAIRAWREQSPNRVRDLWLLTIVTLFGLIYGGFEYCLGYTGKIDALTKYRGLSSLLKIIAFMIALVTYGLGSRWLIKRTFPNSPELWPASPESRKTFFSLLGVAIMGLGTMAAMFWQDNFSSPLQPADTLYSKDDIITGICVLGSIVLGWAVYKIGIGEYGLRPKKKRTNRLTANTNQGIFHLTN